MSKKFVLIVLSVLVVACQQPSSGISGKAKELLQKEGLSYCGENYYSRVVLEPALFSLMPKTLQGDRELFKERLQTVGLVEKSGHYWVGSGCKAHECGTNGAAWTVDEDGVGVAIILKTIPAKKDESDQEFVVYGATESIPKPLLDWILWNATRARPPVVTMK